LEHLATLLSTDSKCYTHKTKHVNFVLGKNKQNLISLSLVYRHSLILPCHTLEYCTEKTYLKSWVGSRAERTDSSNRILSWLLVWNPTRTQFSKRL